MRLRRHAEVLPGTPPPAAAPLVAQVSRWGRLKDMTGVLAGFAEHVARAEPQGQRLRMVLNHMVLNAG